MITTPDPPKPGPPNGPDMEPPPPPPPVLVAAERPTGGAYEY